MRHIRKVLDRIHLLQIDSVNVAVRSHYMPLFSRLGPYDQALLDQTAYEKGEVFEYWAHAACIIPMNQHLLFRHQMAARRFRRHAERHLGDEHPGYLDAIIAEVTARGPLTTAELEDGGARTGPWWGYGKGKLALEVHFAHGTLTTRARRNFARVYDLPERVIPPAVLAQAAPTPEAAEREMVRRSIRALGVGSLPDIADYYRLKARDVLPHLNALVDDGDVQMVTVESWDKPAYLDPSAARPRSVKARALLTPFDSLVWRRDRNERLFNFHYRIEIYTPEAKRIHGYYVLPFLFGERLAARVDVKADRAAGELLVRSAFIEPPADASEVAPALAAELRLMADWLKLPKVVVESRGDLAATLASEVL